MIPGDEILPLIFVGLQYGTCFTFSAGVKIKVLCGLLFKHVEILVNTGQV